jgi:RNA polymerase sigma factor (TIGR02999 family)
MMIPDPSSSENCDSAAVARRECVRFPSAILAMFRMAVRPLIRCIMPKGQLAPDNEGKDQRAIRMRNREMAEDQSNDDNLTHWLQRAQDGDTEAEQRFLLAVNDELRRIAARLLQRSNRPDAQATSLVDEVFVNLFRQRTVDLKNRRYFFKVAATQMLRVLSRRSRARHARKRDGERQRVPLDVVLDDYLDRFESTHSYEFLDLDDALGWLRDQHDGTLQFEVAVYRYLVGLTIAQTAEVLEISPRQVTREWDLARAKLARKLGG